MTGFRKFWGDRCVFLVVECDYLLTFTTTSLSRLLGTALLRGGRNLPARTPEAEKPAVIPSYSGQTCANLCAEQKKVLREGGPFLYSCYICC